MQGNRYHCTGMGMNRPVGSFLFVYAFVLQPIFLVIEMLSVAELVHLKDIRKSAKSFIKSQLAVRWSLLVCITIILVFLRMSIMNFEKPTFKQMDNPIAASEQLLTRVGLLIIGRFNRYANKN